MRRYQINEWFPSIWGQLSKNAYKYLNFESNSGSQHNIALKIPSSKD